MKQQRYLLDTCICAFYLRGRFNVDRYIDRAHRGSAPLCARINRCAESLMLLLSLLLSISPFL